MNSKRLYFIMLGIISLLLIGLLGGAYGANVILQDQAKSVIAARSKSSALEQQQIQLTKAKASILKYKDVSSIAKNIVPQDKDQAQAVREIVKLADKNGIVLGTITFPSSTLGGAAGSSTSTTAKKPAPAANSSQTKLSQLKAAAGINGVYTLQITVQSDTASPVAYDKFVDFLSDLENNRRTALVSAIALQPDPKNPTQVSFTLTIDEYIKP